jgi:hypothetical protein
MKNGKKLDIKRFSNPCGVMVMMIFKEGDPPFTSAGTQLPHVHFKWRQQRRRREIDPLQLEKNDKYFLLNQQDKSTENC